MPQVAIPIAASVAGSVISSQLNKKSSSSGGGDSGGGGSANSTTATQTIDPEVKARLFGLLDRANYLTNQPYEPYPDARLAGFSGDQRDAFNAVREYAGIGIPAAEMATGIAGDFATGAGMTGATSLPQVDLSQYMNPFTNLVANNITNETSRFNTIAKRQLDDRAVSAQAFGGDRAYLAQAEQDRNTQTVLGNTLAGIYMPAFTQAQQFATGDMNRRLAAAGQMANYGQMVQSLGLQGAAALENIGQQQQQLEQRGLDIGYQNFERQRNDPRDKLAFEAGILQGSPLTRMGTTTTTPPAPSALGQIAGLGMAGAGLLGKAAPGISNWWDNNYGTSTYSPGGSNYNAGAFDNYSPMYVNPSSDINSPATSYARGGRVGYAEGGVVDGPDPAEGWLLQLLENVAQPAADRGIASGEQEADVFTPIQMRKRGGGIAGYADSGLVTFDDDDVETGDDVRDEMEQEREREEFLRVRREDISSPFEEEGDDDANRTPDYEEDDEVGAGGAGAGATIAGGGGEDELAGSSGDDTLGGGIAAGFPTGDTRDMAQGQTRSAVYPGAKPTPVDGAGITGGRGEDTLAGGGGGRGRGPMSTLEISKALRRGVAVGGRKGSGADEVPDWALPLTIAGFATMASKSPYALQAIGEGGVAGIAQYMKNEQARAANEVKREATRSTALYRAGQLEQGAEKNALNYDLGVRRDESFRQRTEAGKKSPELIASQIEANRARATASRASAARALREDGNFVLGNSFEGEQQDPNDPTKMVKGVFMPGIDKKTGDRFLDFVPGGNKGKAKDPALVQSQIELNQARAKGVLAKMEEGNFKPFATQTREVDGKQVEGTLFYDSKGKQTRWEPVKADLLNGKGRNVPAAIQVNEYVAGLIAAENGREKPNDADKIAALDRRGRKTGPTTQQMAKAIETASVDLSAKREWKNKPAAEREAEAKRIVAERYARAAEMEKQAAQDARAPSAPSAPSAAPPSAGGPPPGFTEPVTAPDGRKGFRNPTTNETAYPKKKAE